MSIPPKKITSLSYEQGFHQHYEKFKFKGLKCIFHSSIDIIRKSYESNKKFSFQQVTEEHVRQVIFSVMVILPPLWEIFLRKGFKVTLYITLSLITKTTD